MRLVLAISAAALAACATSSEPAPPAGPVRGPDAAPEAGVAELAAPPASARASLGAEAFSARGCAACHTIGGGPKVGPDLAGVTTRRDPAWFRAMVTEPDSMLRDDPVARALHARYRSSMPDLGVRPGEAEALWAYLALVTEPSAFAEAGPGTAGSGDARPGGRARRAGPGPRAGRGPEGCPHAAAGRPHGPGARTSMDRPCDRASPGPAPGSAGCGRGSGECAHGSACAHGSPGSGRG